QAYSETKTWHKKARQRPLTLAQIITSERCGIHSHESQQRPKIQQLGGALEAQHTCSRKRKQAHKNYVVLRNPPPGFDRTKEGLWEGISPSHTVWQPCSSELGAHARAYRCDQQGNVNHGK